jgi:hypothetical protein
MILKTKKILPKKIKIKWLIEGLPDFGISEDKKMYRLSTKNEIKLKMVGYTRGYYLARKFYSITRLRSLLFIPNPEPVERTDDTA